MKGAHYQRLEFIEGLMYTSWTAAIPMSKIEGPLSEYACHEGNYGLEDILRGARVQEKAAADAAKKGSR